MTLTDLIVAIVKSLEFTQMSNLTILEIVSKVKYLVFLLCDDQPDTMSPAQGEEGPVV